MPEQTTSAAAPSAEPPTTRKTVLGWRTRRALVGWSRAPILNRGRGPRRRASSRAAALLRPVAAGRRPADGRTPAREDRQAVQDAGRWSGPERLSEGGHPQRDRGQRRERVHQCQRLHLVAVAKRRLKSEKPAERAQPGQQRPPGEDARAVEANADRGGLDRGVGGSVEDARCYRERRRPAAGGEHRPGQHASRAERSAGRRWRCPCPAPKPIGSEMRLTAMIAIAAS